MAPFSVTSTNLNNHDPYWHFSTTITSTSIVGNWGPAPPPTRFPPSSDPRKIRRRFCADLFEVSTKHAAPRLSIRAPRRIRPRARDGRNLSREKRTT